jgi:hypothetical protein
MKMSFDVIYAKNNANFLAITMVDFDIHFCTFHALQQHPIVSELSQDIRPILDDIAFRT